MHEFPCFYGNDAHAPTVVPRPFFLAPQKRPGNEANCRHAGMVSGPQKWLMEIVIAHWKGSVIPRNYWPVAIVIEIPETDHIWTSLSIII